MKTRFLAAAAVLPLMILTSCSSGTPAGGGSSAGSGGAAAPVSIRFLIPTGTDNSAVADAVIKAFNAKEPNIKVEVESRPGGTEGDNLVKTKLSTGDMAEVFQYNSGSLLQQISPAKNLADLSGESWVGSLDPSFKTTVTSDGKVYGSPWGTFSGGGVLYNKKVYDSLGLKVPTTWAEFMANSAKIKAAGKTAVIGSYSDTWTSQLFVLADYANVAAVDPDWATKYTANKAHYVDAPALAGFTHLEQVFKAGYMNADFNATKYDDALTMLASGDGVQYPMLTFAVTAIAQNHAAQLNDVGFFALPGDDASKNNATVWSPSGNYIPASVTGDKLAAAKKFVAFWATQAGCDAQLAGAAPSGPWAVTSCTLPDSVPQIVKDLQTYTAAKKSTPALEFLSPVKGPNLESITVEVGSGIRSAADGAKLYDEDVKKQAKQLNLPGW